MRNPDEYLIEVGQSTNLLRGWHRRDAHCRRRAQRRPLAATPALPHRRVPISTARRTPMSRASTVSNWPWSSPICIPATAPAHRCRRVISSGRQLPWSTAWLRTLSVTGKLRTNAHLVVVVLPVAMVHRALNWELGGSVARWLVPPLAPQPSLMTRCLAAADRSGSAQRGSEG